MRAAIYLPLNLSATGLPRTPHTAQVRIAELSHEARTQKWVREAFVNGSPGGRKDATALRHWLADRIEQAQCDKLAAGKGKARSLDASLQAAEAVLDSYNTAFHELTRQVRRQSYARPR